MAWVGARYRTFVNGSSLTPSALNAIQDRYLRPTGILADDLDSNTVTTDAALNQTGASVPGQVKRRGASIITGEQSITPAASTPTLMTTPDRVEDIVVIGDGYLAIWAWLGMKKSVGGAVGRVYLYLNEVKVNIGQSGAGVSTQVFATLDGTTSYNAVASNGMNLDPSSSYADPPAAAHHLAGQNGLTPLPILVHPGAGTYDVSLRYENTDGTTLLSAKQRHLYVAAVNFL